MTRRRTPGLVVRLLLGTGGLAALGVGIQALAAIETEKLVSALQWLIGVVVVHDFVLAPIVVVLGVVAARWLATSVRVPLTVALVVWGSLTLLALPVLSGEGTRPDNPSLLDRPYAVSWWVGTAVVAGIVMAATLVRRRSRRRDLA